MAKHPESLEKIGPVYARLMEEIKRRIDVINQVLTGNPPLPEMVCFELCYLQLRKICEVFALACLAAHGNIRGVHTSLMQKTYNADKIIKQLSDLHPQFYPQPSEQQYEQGKITEYVKPITEGFLTKSDLLNLYGECGNYLHRGSIRQILTQWEPRIDFVQISSWVQRIVKLLNHHQIQTIQPDTQLWIIMHDKDHGRVHWAVMKEMKNCGKDI